MKKYILFILSICLIILELLPFGVILRFANPEDVKGFVSHFSYFDLTPFGYANFGPLLTAIISIVLVIVSMVYCIKGKGLTIVKYFSMVGIVTSIMPLLMLGFDSFTVINIIVSVILVCVFVLSIKFKNGGVVK